MNESLIQGFYTLMNFTNFFVITIGILCGIVIGSIPGLTADLAIILCMPITYKMDPTAAVLMCLGLYCGGTYGGSITAILINTPGTPANAATILDGYPLTKQGKPLKALTMALYASTIGGFISALSLIFLAPQIAKITLMFGPPEYLAVAIFGLSIIAGVSGDSVAKGFIAGCLGIFISTIGMDQIAGSTRFAFGNRNLAGGIGLIIALVGLFAVSELLTKSDYNSSDDLARKNKTKIDNEKLTWKEFKRCIKTIIISSGIGTIIGATPGTGGGIAAFVSYDQARKTSKYADNFGKGELEGIAASEAANNGVTGATLIPLLTLGIPGDGVTAVLLGALMLQGMTPGPSLFKEQGHIIYAIMLGLFIVNIVMFVIGRVFTKYYSNITRIPYELISSMIIIYCFAGAYSNKNSSFDLLLVACFGIISYILRKLDFSLVPVLLGIVLGPLAETNFRRSMVLSGGSFTIFFKKPIALAFLTLSVVSVLLFFVKKKKAAE